MLKDPYREEVVKVCPVLKVGSFARPYFRNRGVARSRYPSYLERGRAEQDVAWAVEGRSWTDPMQLVCWAFLLVEVGGIIIWLGYLSGANSFTRGLRVPLVHVLNICRPRVSLLEGF
jgi:hypothetical protein